MGVDRAHSTGKGVGVKAEETQVGFSRGEVEEAFAHWWKVG